MIKNLKVCRESFQLLVDKNVSTHAMGSCLILHKTDTVGIQVKMFLLGVEDNRGRNKRDIKR